MSFVRRAYPGPTPDKEIVVKTPDQLAGDLRSDSVYLIDGKMDVGLTSIIVPQGGLFIRGHGFGVSKLLSSASAFSMFIDDGVFSGDLFIDSIDLEVTGAGSALFDLDNDQNLNAVELTNVNILDTPSMGKIDNYRQGLFSNVALIRCVDGLECDGTWAGGFRATTAIVVQGGPTKTFTGTVFKAGPSLTMAGRFLSDMNVEDINDAGSFCDFAPANILTKGRFQISGLSVNPASNAFPNMPPSDVKARFRNCDGTENTYVGGQWKISTEAVTDIASAGQNVLVKVAGVTAYTDLQHFSGVVDNAFVYEGDQEIGTSMFLDLSFTGSNNDELILVARHWIEDTSSYIDLAESGKFTLGIAGRSEPISLHSFCTFNNLDRFEVWVKNTSGANNVTAVLGGIVSINERPS